MYAIKFTDSAVADVKALPKNIQNRLKKALIEVVSREPIACSRPLNEPLEAFRSFHWRDYRVVYRVFTDRGAVAIVGVGPREAKSVENVYSRLEALAASGELAEKVLVTLRGFSRRKKP